MSASLHPKSSSGAHSRRRVPPRRAYLSLKAPRSPRSQTHHPSRAARLVQDGHEPPASGTKPARHAPRPASSHPPGSPDTASCASRARSEAIQNIHKLRLASKTEESRLRATLDSQVASVTKSKQSLILQQLLDRHHYPDRRIGQELREGFPLTGWLQPSGIWPTAFLPPTLTIDQLLTNAQAITHRAPHRQTTSKKPYGEPPRKKSPTAGFACSQSIRPHTLSPWYPRASASSRRTRSDL